MQFVSTILWLRNGVILRKLETVWKDLEEAKILGNDPDLQGQVLFFQAAILRVLYTHESLGQMQILVQGWGGGGADIRPIKPHL